MNKYIYESQGTECPECGELRDRNWGSVSTFSMKGDCHTNRVRARKYYVKGLDKDAAHEFYDSSIARSKRNINSGWQHYAKMVPNHEKMVEAGVATRRTDSEAQKAKEGVKKMTEAVYNDVDINIGDTLHKPQ